MGNNDKENNQGCLGSILNGIGLGIGYKLSGCIWPIIIIGILLILGMLS